MSSVSSLTSNSVANDYLARSAYRKNGQANEDASGVTTADTQGAAQDSQETSAASTSLVNGQETKGQETATLPALSVQAARQVLDSLTPAIAQAPSWKLSEIQPVGERGLLPSAYV